MKALKRTGPPSTHKVPQPDSKSVLVVVDVQVDFCPEGALAVPRGDEIIPIINESIHRFQNQKLPIVASRDWHPPHHCSFKEQGGPWPVHCVQGSRGGQFHPDLVIPPGSVIISKATDSQKEAYSAFDGTPLEDRLRELDAKTIYIAGLATDYCVKQTVVDARKLGFQVVVLEDAIRGIDETPGDIARAITMMRDAGAIFAQARDLQL